MTGIWPRMRPSPGNVALTLAVIAVEFAGTELVAGTWGFAPGMDGMGVVLLALSAAPLAWRDRSPRLTLLAVAILSILFVLADYQSPFYLVGLIVAVWSAAGAGERVFVLGVTGAVVGLNLVVGFVLGRGHLKDLAGVSWFVGWLVVAYLFGEVWRGRREHLEELEERAVQAERTREEEARRRAGEERMRIARELHDVLAHHISVINVQAGVAVHLLDRQPDQARTALVAINQASKDALRELRATLGVLRQVDDVEPRRPSPGLAQLHELVATAAAAGVAVDVDVAGDPRPLPASTDLAAYRIVQESLTNVARHAGTHQARLSIRYEPSDIVVEVDDPGRTTAPAHSTAPGDAFAAGNGLIGMRERAAALGGELDAGPRADGGFRVRARLPIEARS